jgi:hypothetical protein
MFPLQELYASIYQHRAMNNSKALLYQPLSYDHFPPSFPVNSPPYKSQSPPMIRLSHFHQHGYGDIHHDALYTLSRCQVIWIKKCIITIRCCACWKVCQLIDSSKKSPTKARKQFQSLPNDGNNLNTKYICPSVLAGGMKEIDAEQHRCMYHYEVQSAIDDHTSECNVSFEGMCAMYVLKHLAQSPPQLNAESLGTSNEPKPVATNSFVTSSCASFEQEGKSDANTMDTQSSTRPKHIRWEEMKEDLERHVFHTGKFVYDALHLPNDISSDGEHAALVNMLMEMECFDEEELYAVNETSIIPSLEVESSADTSQVNAIDSGDKTKHKPTPSTAVSALSAKFILHKFIHFVSSSCIYQTYFTMIVSLNHSVSSLANDANAPVSANPINNKYYLRRIKVQESNEHSRFHYAAHFSYQPTYTRRKLELNCHWITRMFPQSENTTIECYRLLKQLDVLFQSTVP